MQNIDTVTGIAEDAEPSIHLTLGLDTHIWSLHFATMREFALRRAGLEDKLLATKLDQSVFWELQVKCSDAGRNNECGVKYTYSFRPHYLLGFLAKISLLLLTRPKRYRAKLWPQG